MQPRKARLPRVERNDDFHLEDDSGHGWAVSYADFLMVLLSFFILFFSTDQQKESVVSKILLATQKQTGEGSGAGSSQPGGRASEEKLGFPDMPGEALRAALAHFRIRTFKTREELTLMFPENIYLPGQIHLNAETEEQLRSLAEKLRPFIEKVDLTFIGHTDGAPLKRLKGKVLTDNFDLSVIRASKALQHVVRLGLPPERLSAQGAGSGVRNSRSLSLVIRPRTQSPNAQREPALKPSTD